MSAPRTSAATWEPSPLHGAEVRLLVEDLDGHGGHYVNRFGNWHLVNVAGAEHIVADGDFEFVETAEVAPLDEPDSTSQERPPVGDRSPRPSDIGRPPHRTPRPRPPSGSASTTRRPHHDRPRCPRRRRPWWSSERLHPRRRLARRHRRPARLARRSDRHRPHRVVPRQRLAGDAQLAHTTCPEESDG